MEAKWGAIAIAVTVIAMFGSIAISSVAKSNARSQCFISFAMTDRTAEEIEKICK